MIERRRKRDHAIRRNFAVRWLEPDDSACRGGNANRAARVGADRRLSHLRRDRRRRSSARAPGGTREVTRIAYGSVRRIFTRRAEGELVKVGLSDEDRAGVAQALNDWS